jgi:tetratricopeptide (TPR) repeat protein
MNFLLRLIAVAAILSGIALAGPASAQSDEAVRLLRESQRLYRMGDYDGAARSALEHTEALKAGSEYGENHLDYALAIERLAGIYEMQRRTLEAEAVYKRALVISEGILSPGDDRLDAPKIALAGFYARQGRFAEAETLLTNLVALRELVRGRSDASLARVLRTLLSLYDAQERKDDAKPLLARLLSLATCDPKISDLENLAATLKQYEEAKLGFQRKTKTGVYDARPGPGSDTPARSARRASADLEGTLSRLSLHRAETAALIYDRESCVYLVSRDGIEFVAPLAFSHAGSETVAAIRTGLNVDVRAAARTPQKRSSPPVSTAPARRVSTKPDFADAAATIIPSALHQKLASGRFSRLLILATGDLASVPFAALPIGGKQLVDYVAPVVLADVDGLAKSTEFDADFRRGEKLVVGDPDLSADKVWEFSPLPAAREEAREIATLVDARAVLGPDASRSAVNGLLTPNQGRLSLIYFATHGIADADNPMDASFLALKGSHLLAADIKKFKLTQHPLVVMSACQTGLGKVFEGGIFGLARAWHGAGASQVVMSLWNVSDAATRVLMVAFVRSLTEGLGAEHALRAAMLATRESHPDPALWAGFSVFGLPTATPIKR